LINLKNIEIDKSWSFSDKTIKDTSYITHGYYTYPAKFIPQLASRLILEYSKPSDLVVDPFMGSGTTVVESIVNKRIGGGTDINDLAFFITQVKTEPIETNKLLFEFDIFNNDINQRLNGSFDYFVNKAKANNNFSDRIDYWFPQVQKDKLTIIFDRIKEVEDIKTKNFFLVSFSQILKSASIWLQKSVKPTRDLKKEIREPQKLFFDQTKKMINRNDSFFRLLDKEVISNINKYRIIKNSDARNLPFDEGTVSLIVTSPPYVTSYEYADLHQLPSLWLNYFDVLSDFRKKFIGSSYKERSKIIELKSNIGDSIVNSFYIKKIRNEVYNYFADMLECFFEMKRVLKKGGIVCIVIGNTQIKGVDIINAEVFLEQFEYLGFKLRQIVNREIPSKMLPSTRDTKTGKFTKNNDSHIKLAYPCEYILILEKI